MRNRQMIVRWLMANSKAIDVREREGKTFYVMIDAGAFHEGVGRLLAEVQRIKAEGDYDAAVKLFDTYGVHFDARLRDEVVARVDRLKMPSYTGFVQPRLEASQVSRRSGLGRQGLVSDGPDDADARVLGPEAIAHGGARSRHAPSALERSDDENRGDRGVGAHDGRRRSGCRRPARQPA